MSLALLGILIAVLLVARVPVAFAFLGPSLLYMMLEGQSSGMALRNVTNALGSFPLLAVPLFIFLGGILGGFFTPTEAAAVGVVYILLVGIVQRSLTLKGFIAAVKESVMTTAAIMLIVASASLLGYILAKERLPQALTEVFFSLTDNPTVFMALAAVLMLILGTVIDATAILVLVVPILMPIALQYGVDPIVLGVMLIISLMIGLLTPPVGTVLFVTAAVSKTRVGEVFRGCLPFMIPSLVIVVLVILFPDAVMWLPGVLGL